MIRVLLGYLLHVANSDPPRWDGEREGFYRLKDRILRRFGKLETTATLFGPVTAYDWQRIVKRCWGCAACRPESWHWSYKCDGDGVYATVFVGLERWHLGGRVFHRPATRRDTLPADAHVSIEGLVRHRSYGRWSYRAALVLAAVFDRPLAWRLSGLWERTWWCRDRWAWWRGAAARKVCRCGCAFRWGYRCPRCAELHDACPF